MRNDPPGMKPTFYAIAATVLVSIAGLLFVNLNEDPEMFIILTSAFAIPGTYLMLAGAVARGIEMARRD